jgi:site-specific recombinase XerD
MKLSEAIDAYIAMKTSLGMSFDSARRLLRQFSRETGNPAIGDVQAEAVATFLRGRGTLNATWGLKYRILSGFYKFAISRGHTDNSPLPGNVPKLPPQQTPYVYSIDELRWLLEATSVVHVTSTPLQSPMYRTLLILLYGSALRIGEALNLTLRDVDVIERIITVRDTKFFKTRLVPIGPKLAGQLAVYIQQRRQLPLPSGEDSRLFTTKTGRGWPYPHVITLFQKVRRAAGIGRATGECRPPRIHDIRHTAAVHRVIAWYRTGRDVQLLLPRLATYLGHIDIKSTQRYLHMTTDLLQEASRRFAKYAQSENAS